VSGFQPTNTSKSLIYIVCNFINELSQSMLDNPIGDDGAIDIFHSIINHPSLKELWMDSKMDKILNVMIYRY
jgi:hypothetical protein